MRKEASFDAGCYCDRSTNSGSEPFFRILPGPARLLGAALLVMAMAGGAIAAAPAPWLCRDKPVFSSSSPSRMNMTLHDDRQWQVFLMQFDVSGGGHDGFTITDSYQLSPGKPHASGQVSGGRYFAVALYRSGGYWICPENARDRMTAGTIADLCYGASAGACDVTLNVKSAK